MAKLSTWTLLAVFSLLVVKGFGQDLSFADALDDEPLKPTPKRHVQPMVPGKDPAKPKPKWTDEFDLADALDPNNEIKGKGENFGKKGGGFSDSDLADIGEDETYNPDKGKGGGFSDRDLTDIGEEETYNPDKGKGGRVTGGSDSDENDTGTTAETGTIAGIVSAIGMALVGAVSGYISYQKKKFCFSIQQSLNTDMVKADAPDAVVAQEPQAIMQASVWILFLSDD